MKGHCTSCFKYDTLTTVKDFDRNECYLCKDCLLKRRLLATGVIVVTVIIIVMLLSSL